MENQIKCNECPYTEGAYECYNNTINLTKGYWRASINSSNITFCYNLVENCE
jgi:hypothetical protein